MVLKSDQRIGGKVKFLRKCEIMMFDDEKYGTASTVVLYAWVFGILMIYLKVTSQNFAST